MITIIIQARMGSTRLPGKIMKKACDTPLLQHLIDRVQKSKTADKIIIATTTNKSDDVIQNFCEENKIFFFRGSENDVLSRYKLTADYFNSDIVVRIVSDCPLIDPKVIDKTVNFFMDHNYDFVSNCYPLPRTYPEGYSVEVFSKKILDELYFNAKKPSDREHVTFSLWMNPEKYSAYRVDYEKDLSHYRFNLDYDEDYLLIKSVFEALYPNNPDFSMEDIISWLDLHPKIFKINRRNPSYENILKSFEEDIKQGFVSNGTKYFKI
jgi:spore coat polysaccharide biosynthesis protein SpsF